MIQKCMPLAWKQKIRLSLAQTKGVLLAYYNQIIYQEKEQLELERLGYLRWGEQDWMAPLSDLEVHGLSCAGICRNMRSCFFDMTKD